jgi:putative transposase
MHNHICAFGDVMNEEMKLPAYGEVVKKGWLRTSEIGLDVFAITPKHSHGIIVLKEICDTYGRGMSHMPLP